MTATPENRRSRIKMLVEDKSLYEDGELGGPPTKFSGEIATKIYDMIKSVEPGVFPDSEDGGIRFEWNDMHSHVVMVFPNSETKQFGTGVIYWYLPVTTSEPEEGSEEGDAR